MTKYHLMLMAAATMALSACSSTKPQPLGGVPTAARPEDVAAADEFFKTNKGRGMIPPKEETPTLTPANSGVVVELDQQRAYLYHGDKLLAFTKLASGRPNYRTETGTYVIGQKNLNHRSTLYGNFVSVKTGSVMMSDVARGFDPTPVGGKFEGSLMKYFQRFCTPNGRMTAMGFHTGVLPGYAASHGCVRLPDGMASWLFQNVPMGTPVIINGDKLGVPMGTVQKRPKRAPKVHSSLKQKETPPAPVTPPAGSEASAPATPEPAPAQSEPAAETPEKP